MNAQAQDRLFDTRLVHFCPGEHCKQLCSAGTCTCKPCPKWCEHCKARKAAGRRRVNHTGQFETNFAHRQPRLFGGPPRGAVPDAHNDR
jgi:hypothetical protein